jgi:hypothetical protein
MPSVGTNINFTSPSTTFSTMRQYNNTTTVTTSSNSIQPNENSGLLNSKKSIGNKNKSQTNSTNNSRQSSASPLHTIQLNQHYNTTETNSSFPQQLQHDTIENDAATYKQYMKERLDTFFEISKRRSSITQELRAGLVTFVTMAYILVVNAQVR